MGDSGLRVPVAGPEEAQALAAAAGEGRWPGVLDVVAGLGSVLFVVAPGALDLLDLAERVGRLDPAASPPRRRRAHRLVVALDGPDLDEVCRLTGLTPEGVADLLGSATLEVAMVGFSPGFAYLRGLPDVLAGLPRRPSPRRSVPAGSLAMAGGFCAVYPQATPGGWQLVGRTPARLFDPDTAPYALLAPGDTVSFELSAPAKVAAAPSPSPDRPAQRAPSGALALVVGDPGVFTMVQDGGRPHLAHLGVPAAGPADPLGHALANRLVGNRWDAPALEVTARGPRLVARRPLHVAVVGEAAVTVDGRDVGAGHVVPVGAGQHLDVGPVRAGLRCSVAVAGGLEVTGVMGSAATDVLSWLGPGPLRAGDELGAAVPGGPMADRLAPGAPGRVRGGPRRLRVLPGPHREWFDEGALDRLGESTWVVDPASDRVGLRLTPVVGGPVGRRPDELASEGMVTGAVQVPPDGHPVVLGPDHATLGGYPVVAVVAACDRWLLGQCRAGDEVHLVPVSVQGAAAALSALRREAAAAVVGRYPTVPG